MFWLRVCAWACFHTFKYKPLSAQSADGENPPLWWANTHKHAATHSHRLLINQASMSKHVLHPTTRKNQFIKYSRFLRVRLAFKENNCTRFDVSNCRKPQQKHPSAYKVREHSTAEHSEHTHSH